MNEPESRPAAPPAKTKKRRRRKKRKPKPNSFVTDTTNCGIPAYDSVRDPHVQHFFAHNPHVKHHMVRSGFIDNRLRPLNQEVVTKTKRVVQREIAKAAQEALEREIEDKLKVRRLQMQRMRDAEFARVRKRAQEGRERMLKTRSKHSLTGSVSSGHGSG